MRTSVLKDDPQIAPLVQSFQQYLNHHITIKELQKNLAGNIAVLETDVPFEIRVELIKINSTIASIRFTMSYDKQKLTVKQMLANLEKTIQSAA